MPCYDPEGARIDEEFRITTARLSCIYLSTLEWLGLDIPKWAEKWWEYHKKYDLDRNSKQEIDSRLGINNG